MKIKWNFNFHGNYSVLNFFSVQKLIFGHFWNHKNFFSWNWFIWFHEFFFFFFGPGLFSIFWPTELKWNNYLYTLARCLKLTSSSSSPVVTWTSSGSGMIGSKCGSWLVPSSSASSFSVLLMLTCCCFWPPPKKIRKKSLK